MTRTRKALWTVLVVGAAASVASDGIFSAFSSTTSNPDNTFSAGTVTLSDNDSGGALYQVTNARPVSSRTLGQDELHAGARTGSKQDASTPRIRRAGIKHPAPRPAPILEPPSEAQAATR